MIKNLECLYPFFQKNLFFFDFFADFPIMPPLLKNIPYLFLRK